MQKVELSLPQRLSDYEEALYYVAGWLHDEEYKSRIAELLNAMIAASLK